MHAKYAFRICMGTNQRDLRLKTDVDVVQKQPTHQIKAMAGVKYTHKRADCPRYVIFQTNTTSDKLGRL